MAQTPGYEDQVVAVLSKLVPVLLSVLERLAFVRRHLQRGAMSHLMPVVEGLEQELSDAMRSIDMFQWPDRLAPFRDELKDVGVLALKALGELDARPQRAMRHAKKAVQSLYPFAAVLPPVSRFFLEPSRRHDATLLARLADTGAVRGNVGVLHARNVAGSRGGFSAYVPEYYDADASWPLIVALHGGSSDGADFLWEWLREARGRGMILICPTSQQETWSIQGADGDAVAIAALVDWARSEWNVDPHRILLTGVSDGATYSYLCGLTRDAPFTHLAPISGGFHSFLLDGLDATGKPVYVVHGALDQVFPVETARLTAAALTAAGASVTYREIDDLPHCYPAEENGAILDWFMLNWPLPAAPARE
jgi:phospholipase/carboxylesterase